MQGKNIMKITNVKTIAVTSIITFTVTLMSVYVYESQMSQRMKLSTEESCKSVKSAASVESDAEIEREMKKLFSAE